MEITYDGLLDFIDKFFGVLKNIIQQIFGVIGVIQGATGGSEPEEEAGE